MKKFAALITCFFLFQIAGAQITVWPGDANNNGVANHFDLLYIGQAYGSTGPVRQPGGNAWSAQTLNTVWNSSLPNSGINFGYLDCNGDGTIDLNDVQAIEANYDLTHGFLIQDTFPPGPATPLFFQFPNDSIQAATTDTIEVMIGGTGATITNLYGISFTVTFDTSLVDSVYLVTNNSILSGPISQIISISNYSKTNGSFDISISRTNQTVVSVTGAAPIAGIGLVMVDNLKKAAAVKMLNLGLENALGISAQEDLIAIHPMGDSLVIYTGIDDLKEIRQQVNFVRQGDWLLARSQQNWSLSMSLWDMAGRKIVHNQSETSRESQLNIAGLPAGIYIVQINTSKGFFSEKIFIH